MGCVGRRSGWLLGSEGRELSGSGERSDAARNRTKILEAARALFEERGVTRVTMEDVARAAGVGKGTLYRRFPHKGLLCQALLDEPTRRFQEETLALVGGPEAGPLEKLDDFLGRLVRFTEDNLDLLYGGHEPLSGAERLAHLSHPARDWQRWTVLGLLREAKKAGEIGREADTEYLALALLAPLEIDSYCHQRRVLGYTPGRVRAGVRSLVPRRS